MCRSLQTAVWSRVRKSAQAEVCGAGHAKARKQRRVEQNMQKKPASSSTEQGMQKHANRGEGSVQGIEDGEDI